MLNHSVFSVETYVGGIVPPGLLKQYGRLRYDCFAVDDPYVCMNHQNRTELDHFDELPTTMYLMVISKQAGHPKKLVSAVRLIPTVEAYDLEQPSWSYLTNHFALPKANNVVEGSRWVGKSSRTYEGKLSTALLMLQLYQCAIEHEFNQLLGVVALKSQEWFEKRNTNLQASEVRHQTATDGEILITTINIDKFFLESARAIMLESMEFWSMAHTVVATRKSA
jgi:N-acyl-L-homoserine lactone synthetase